VPKREGYKGEQSLFHVKSDKCMETAAGLCGSWHEKKFLKSSGYAAVGTETSEIGRWLSSSPPKRGLFLR
jgi:hypothetical protein